MVVSSETIDNALIMPTYEYKCSATLFTINYSYTLNMNTLTQRDSDKWKHSLLITQNSCMKLGTLIIKL